MKYYILTIEQTFSDGAYAEYANVEKVADENLAQSKFYTKLANVAADLDKNHTFMDIKIVNSIGGVVKRDTIGSYVEEE